MKYVSALSQGVVGRPVVVCGFLLSSLLGTTLNGNTLTESQKLLAPDGADYHYFGTSAAVDGNLMVVGASNYGAIDVFNDGAGAVYVYLRNDQATPTDRSDDTWGFEATLYPSDPVAGGDFGYRVSVSGDTIAAASGGGPRGVHLFREAGGVWTENPFEITIPTADLALHKDTLVVGSPWNGSGEARVYKRSGSTWAEQQTLLPFDGVPGDRFGQYVALHGNRIAVSSYQDDGGKGSVYVYEFVAGGGTNAWVLSTKVAGTSVNTTGGFGRTVEIENDVLAITGRNDLGHPKLFSYLVKDGQWVAGQTISLPSLPYDSDLEDNALVIGLPQDTPSAAQLYRRYGDYWSLESELVQGTDLIGDHFGYPVALSGDAVVVGAQEDNANGEAAGAAYTFYVPDPTVTQQKPSFSVTPAEAASSPNGSGYGEAFAVSSDKQRLVMGGWGGQINGIQTGAAYAFEWDPVLETYVEHQKLAPADLGQGANFGEHITMSSDGSVVAISASYADVVGRNSGAVYIYRHDGTAYQLERKLYPDNAQTDDSFGYIPELTPDGNWLAVGALGRTTSVAWGGSAYVFHFDGTSWNEVQQIIPSTPVENALFGYQLSFNTDGSVLLISAPEENNQSGAIYFYQRVSGVYQNEHKMLNPAGGAGDWFGYGVELNGTGNKAFVGAFRKSVNGVVAGTVYVLSESAGVWSVDQELLPQDAALQKDFGLALDLSQDEQSLLISANRDFSGGPSSGATYVYKFDGVEWYPHVKLIAGEFESLGCCQVQLVDNGQQAYVASRDEIFVFDILSGAATDLGVDVAVSSDTITSSGDPVAELTFSTVVDDGETAVIEQTLEGGQEPPPGFRVGDSGVVFDIVTTAEFVDGVEVCFNFSDLGITDTTGLALWHSKDGVYWEDITTSVDEAQQIICGFTDSFSLFGVFEDIDKDDDGLTDVQELEELGSDPWNPDTDGDGLLDGTEVEMAQSGGCPSLLDEDSDNDGLLDGAEVLLGTNPCNADTDGDGLLDLVDGDPLDPATGGIPGDLEQLARDIAVLIRGLDPAVFNAPNLNANMGRQNVFSTHADNASHAIGQGNPGAAITQLSVILERVDGEAKPKDWMDGSNEKTLLAELVELLIQELAVEP